MNTIAFSIADKEPVPKKSSVKHSVWMEEITGYFNCGYILHGMLKFRKIISESGIMTGFDSLGFEFDSESPS